MNTQALAERARTAEYRQTRAWRHVLHATGLWGRRLALYRYHNACRRAKRLHRALDRATTH
jgi:hypothetical protein